MPPPMNESAQGRACALFPSATAIPIMPGRRGAAPGTRNDPGSLGGGGRRPLAPVEIIRLKKGGRRFLEVESIKRRALSAIPPSCCGWKAPSADVQGHGPSSRNKDRRRPGRPLGIMEVEPVGNYAPIAPSF